MSTIAVTGRVVLALLAALFGVTAGLGALLGAATVTATVTARPPLFLLAGLAIFCAAYLLGLLLATRGISPSRKWRIRAVSFCAGTALLVSLFALTTLLPMSDPHLAPASV